MINPLARFDLPERIYAAPIGPAALRVIMALGEYADREGRCWPSQARLGRDCRIDRATVNRAIQELIGAGFLLVLGRQRRACRYQIVSPGRASCDDTVTQGPAAVDKPDLLTPTERSVTKRSQDHVTGRSHKPTQGTLIDPDIGEASKGLSGASRPAAVTQPNSEARPAASHGRGAAQGPRNRNSLGPAGGRARGSPRGRGSKAAPSTGPPASPTQRAKGHLSAMDYGDFLKIAQQAGEKAALDAFELDERGNPRCQTQTTQSHR